MARQWRQRAMARFVYARFACTQRCKAKGPLLQSTTGKLLVDRDVVLAAVQRYGWYLKHASAEMQADREVVLAAVTKDGYVLQYASAELQADQEVVLAAMQSKEYYYNAAQMERIGSYRCAMVSISGGLISYPGLTANSNGDNLKYASAELRANREFVLAAVQKVDALFALRHVSAELRLDPQVRYLLSLSYEEYIARCEYPCRVKYSEIYWKECYDERCAVNAKISLARDRDALGAAVGVRTTPAPHTALNGAPEVLPIVYCLLAWRVEAM